MALIADAARAAITGDIMEERNRLDKLSEKIRRSAEAVEPEIPSSELGAIHGEAFELLGVRLSAYIFSSWKDADTQVAKVRERFSNEYVAAGTNGRIFFFGHTPHGGPQARQKQYALADMASEIAGKE